MNAGEEVETIMKDSSSSSCANNIFNSNNTVVNSSASIIRWDLFFQDADDELTNLIQTNPRKYEFRHPEHVPSYRPASFGVEGFASAVFWLCVIRQARAESKQNAKLNEQLAPQHRKRHRYDGQVGDVIWREVLLEVLKPSTMSDINNEGALGDVLAASQNKQKNKKNVSSSSSQQQVSISKIVNRVGGKVDKDACTVMKLLISGMESESGHLESKAEELLKNSKQQQSSSPQVVDGIPIEDAMHLLCVKRLCDIDDSLLEDMEKWCHRRVALWIMERFSPLDFPSSSSIAADPSGRTQNGVSPPQQRRPDPCRKYYRPYLLRSFFKIVSTAVARVLTRLFTTSCTGGDISQTELWQKIKSKQTYQNGADQSANSQNNSPSSSGRTSPTNSPQNSPKTTGLSPATKQRNVTRSSWENENHYYQQQQHPQLLKFDVPPEAAHAKAVQLNVEKILLETASLAPVVANKKKSVTAVSASSTKRNERHRNSHLQFDDDAVKIEVNKHVVASARRPHSAVSFLQQSTSSPRRGFLYIKKNLTESTASTSSSVIDDPSIVTSLSASKNEQTSSTHQQQQQQNVLKPHPPPSSNNNNIASSSNTHVVVVATSREDNRVRQQMKEQLKHSLYLRNSGNRPNIILTDNTTAVRRDVAQRLAAQRRTIALEEGEVVESEDDEKNDKTRRQNQELESFRNSRKNRTRFVGSEFEDKGIAIGDDSDYKIQLIRNSASVGLPPAFQIRDALRKLDTRTQEEIDAEQVANELADARSMLLSIQRLGGNGGGGNNKDDAAAAAAGAGAAASATNHQRYQNKLLQERALSARMTARAGIDGDRKALSAHFGDLRTVVSEMEKARMNQLLQLQYQSDHHNHNHNHHQKDDVSKQQENAESTLQMKTAEQQPVRTKEEIEFIAKKAAAAKIKQLQVNRPRSAFVNSSTTTSRNNGQQMIRLAIHGLSKCAEASLLDSEELVGHVQSVKAPQRYVTLTPRASTTQETNLKRWSIRNDLESVMQRTAKAETLAKEQDKDDATRQLLLHHFKRPLSDQGHADIQRSVSVAADRARAESARNKAERHLLRQRTLKIFSEEVAVLNLSDDAIPKRCTTGSRTQEYYNQLHSCKQRIDAELCERGYEYLIKERNKMRDLAMIVHRLMAIVRRNFAEHVAEFEEFEIKRHGRKNSAVKRAAEYL